MKKLIKRLYCGFWRGHDYIFTSPDIPGIRYQRCRYCGKTREIYQIGGKMQNNMYGDAYKMPCQINCSVCKRSCKKNDGDRACKKFKRNDNSERDNHGRII